MSALLEVMIGLILLYFLLSVLCSGLNELVAGLTKRRARHLEAGIASFLSGGLKDAVYGHPIIKTLSTREGGADDRKQERKASYIPSDTLSLALASVLGSLKEDGTPGAGQQSTTRSTLLAGVRRGLDRITDGDVKQRLMVLLAEADGDLEAWRGNVEKLFDQWMDRLSGWYARRAKRLLFIWALGVTVFFNVDTFEVGSRLWNDNTLRAAVVAEAEARVAATPPPDETLPPASGETPEPTAPGDQLQEVVRQVEDIEGLQLPLGWPTSVAEFRTDPRVPRNFWPEAVVKLLGFLVTATALTLGAPFWFDLLNRFVNFRAAGPPPPSREEQQSGRKT